MAFGKVFWSKLRPANDESKFSVLFKMCLVLVCVTGGNIVKAELSCATTKSIFENERFFKVDVLEKPTTDGFCNQLSCCGTNSAARLSSLAKRELDSVIQLHSQKLANEMIHNANKFDETFRQLLMDSRATFHGMFMRTYGMIYQNHVHVFTALFTDLERYHATGGLDLAAVMEEFFAILYQKMFVVLNSQYHFDNKYLTCVNEHMKDLQPFGDVPRKLSVQVKRAFVATRTFMKALSEAGLVATKMATIPVSPWCGAVAGRVRWCAACAGSSTPLCPRLCLNLALACLPQHADLNQDWNAFVDVFEKVGDRLLGPFNIEMVVEPINIKISEAIMNFQEHSTEISQRVFTGCGKPVLGQKPQDPGYLSHPRQTRSINAQDETRNTESDEDFVIEASYETLVKKNPQLLSRGNLRKRILDNSGSNNVDFKAKNSVDFKMDGVNDIYDDISGPLLGLRKDVARNVRVRRVADPGARKAPIELEYETYNFDREDDGGSRRKGGKNQRRGGAKKKKPDDDGEASPDDKHSNTPSLEKMVRDIKKFVADTRHTWLQLPYEYCKVDNHNANDNEGKGDCWNSTHVARYTHPLAGEGSSALATNPEARSSSSSAPATGKATTQTAAILTAQQFTLRAITTKLRYAYNGLDVDWGDVEERPSAMSEGSGSGSGDKDDTDDTEEDSEERGGPPDQEEDDEHSVEGSGNGAPDFDHKEEEPSLPVDRFRPPVGIPKPEDIPTSEGDDNYVEMDHNNIDTNSVQDSPSSSGSQGKPQMSLHRALITYLFPIVCVWFGGIITDIA